MKRIYLLLMIAAAAALGCQSVPRAPVVNMANIAELNGTDGPFWLAFHRGDELPVDIAVTGGLVEATSQTVTLKANQDFFVLIGDGEPRVSLDRKTFVSHSQAVTLGLALSKLGKARASANLRYSVSHD